ncbi:hypothetical protein HPB52_004692 [Rhipicephalus sanguineus]|uniref:Peptidase M13 N-terminal domain-containing protein n=1 Tax=Rhipicephalus sanguineus TaxID=34632 RepID=A0A9D4QJD0_RHISA|nr:hypothetical protein HPB52_004692 [Rhipicephalus sanguineus]
MEADELGAYLAKSRESDSVVESDPVCRRYAVALEFSRQEHADPCYSFYRYVCGNWAQRRFDSVLDLLLVTFQQTVTSMAMRTQAPAHFQNPSQRAARAYTSCIAVLDKKEREVGELKAILYNADLRWPQPASTGNVLSPFVYLCKDWSLLFIFGFTKNREGGYTLGPTGQFDKVLQVWEQALYSSKHTSLFNILYEDHVTDESTAIKYAQMAILENKTIAALRKVKDIKDRHVYSSSNIWALSPHIRRRYWQDALKARLGITYDVKIPIRVDQVTFVRTFLNMTSDYGDANLMLYMGWVVAVLFSIYTDSQIMTEYLYGTRDVAEIKHKELCFHMVQRTMGFALEAEYVQQVAPAQARADVSTMVGHLYRAYSRMLSSEGNLFPPEVQMSAYKNGTGAVFEYVDRSSSFYLTRVFSAYTDMSPLLSKTWEAINKGFSSVLPSEVSPWPMRVVRDTRTNRKITLLARLDVGAGNFSLMPYAFDFPVYQLEAPLSIRYGSLGSVVASSMAAMFFANISTWNETYRDEMMHEVTCFFRRSFDSWDSISAVEWAIIYRMASVGALWEAYSLASNSKGEYLSGHKSIRSDQLFFFFWCYLQCGEPAGEHSCNGPLKHLPAFSRTFKCSKGSPMSMEWRCSFFH